MEIIIATQIEMSEKLNEETVSSLLKVQFGFILFGFCFLKTCFAIRVIGFQFFFLLKGGASTKN